MKQTHVKTKALPMQPAPMQTEARLIPSDSVRRPEMRRPRKNNLAALFKTGE